MRKTAILLLTLSFATGLTAQDLRLVVPIGHTSAVTSVAFSKDGTKVLTGSGDRTAKLWDLSGRELQTFMGHESWVNAVAMSSDGQYVVTGSSDKTAKLWDLSGSELQTFAGHSEEVVSVAISPDGQRVLTGSWDATAKLWDLSGRELQTFRSYGARINAVAFSPDGQRVLTGSQDGTARLWDLSGHVIQFFYGHTSVVSAVAMSPDGTKVLTGSHDKTAKLWDVSGTEIQSFEGHAQFVWSVAFSPNGQQVLTGSADYTAVLWDVSGRKQQSFAGHSSSVNSVAFSPDGQKVLTGSWEGTAKLWDVSGQERQAFRGYAESVWSVGFSPDGQRIFTGSSLGIGKLWDIPGGKLHTLAGHGEDILSVAFSADGQYVLTGSADYTARLWDVTGKPLQTFAGHGESVNSVAFSPKDSLILTGSGDHTAKLWNFASREIQTFTGHTSDVNAVAFSPDGQKVLTGSDDKTLKIWEMTDSEPQSFFVSAFGVKSVACSPDGQKILTGTGDKTAQMWDFLGQEAQTFTDHDAPASSAVFSRDGLNVLTGSRDGTAKLWNLKGNLLQTFRGHSGAVRSIVFSPDGKKVLTGSSDNTSKLWETNTGQCLATLIALDSTDWVVTTTSGLFDASPGAMNLMYYLKGIEVIGLEQIKERYYEPGLLGKLMGFNQDSLRAVDGFGAVPLYPEMAANIAAGQSKLAVTLTPRTGGIGQLSVFVNGKEVLEDANPQRDTALVIDLTQFSEYYLPTENNTIGLRVYNEAGWLKSGALELSYQPPATSRNMSSVANTGMTALRPQPSLYAIVVGTADYAGDKLDLTYADLDANYFSQALRAAAPGVCADKVAITLLNTQADTPNRQGASSKAAIRQAFTDLVGKAKAQDVLVIYFSGHGVTYGTAENAQFYYLTKDITTENLSDPDIRNNYAISSTELTDWIKAIPALKQVMVIDACNSGRIVEDLAVRKDLSSTQIRALDRMKDRTGMFILTGSAADKVSYEAGQYGQSLLTYSLLQGMSGLALTEDKRVDVMTLFQYSRDKVPDLARGIGGIQTPVLAFPADGASFDIGIVGAGVSIPIAQVRPVFIRNVFQNEMTFDDELGLGQAMADHFRTVTTKGAQAPLIYVDVNEYENAYAVKGRYTLAGDTVTVRARLFKGKAVVGEAFTVAGKANELPALIDAIMAQVEGMLE